MLSRLFGLRSSFDRLIRGIARELGASVLELDDSDDSALLQLPGKYAPYPVHVAVKGGRSLLVAFTTAKWTGRAPAAAHVLAEKLDRESRSVSFQVKTYDSGRTRLSAAVMVRGRLTADVLTDAAAEMVASLIVADDLLRENGYA